MPTYKQIPVQIATAFDDFGLLLGIPRFPLESNVAYRRRLLSSGKAWGSSTRQGLVNGISTELGLPPYNAADKAFFALTYMPILVDPLVDPSDGDSLTFSVYVNATQFSDYDLTGTTTNSYKLWKFSDGTCSRLLEFKTIPPVNSHLRIEYYRLEDGLVRRWTDETNVDEKNFIAMSAESPAPNQIEVYELTDSNFQSTYLLDSAGRPTEMYKAIVARIHKMYPILWGKWIWGKTFWDVADPAVTGIEFIPNLFDLSTINLGRNDFDSGVGYGTDCSVASIRVGSDQSQRADISPGYFYLRNDEFYLYGQKSHALSGDFFLSTGPVVGTLNPGGDILYETPFAKTWPGIDKLRQTIALSGKYSYFPGDWSDASDPWFSIDISGYITFSGTIDVSEVSLEYEGGDMYTCPIDFNPAHNSVRGNKFLAITEVPVSAEMLNLTYIDVFSKRGYDATFDVLDLTGLPLNYDLTVRVDLTDQRGAPVTNPEVFVELTATYSGVLLEMTNVYLDENGSACHTFHDAANRPAVSPMDFVISGCANDEFGELGVGYEINIPLGICSNIDITEDA